MSAGEGGGGVLICGEGGGEASVGPAIQERHQTHYCALSHGVGDICLVTEVMLAIR